MRVVNSGALCTLQLSGNVSCHTSEYYDKNLNLIAHGLKKKKCKEPTNRSHPIFGTCDV